MQAIGVLIGIVLNTRYNAVCARDSLTSVPPSLPPSLSLSIYLSYTYKCVYTSFTASNLFLFLPNLTGAQLR